MSVLTAPHFWEWFQANSQALLDMTKSSNEQFDYWDNECKMHVQSFCPRGLGLELIWCSDGQNALAIITSFGRPEYFAAAEAFVEQAPYIKEWIILALYPPLWIDYRIAQSHQLPGFEPVNLRFCPYDTLEPAPKKSLVIYVENRHMVTKEHEMAVHDVVHNLLGERVYTQCINWIGLCACRDAPPELLPALLPISELPKWFDDLSQTAINKKGKIIQKKA